jgi:hypothetical protein
VRRTFRSLREHGVLILHEGALHEGALIIDDLARLRELAAPLDPGAPPEPPADLTLRLADLVTARDQPPNAQGAP